MKNAPFEGTEEVLYLYLCACLLSAVGNAL